MSYRPYEPQQEMLLPASLHLISKKPQPTEEQAHVVSHPTASM